MAAKTTFTATHAGITVELATTRKITHVVFYFSDGAWTKFATFHGGTRANADKTGSQNVYQNRPYGTTNYKVVPASAK